MATESDIDDILGRHTAEVRKVAKDLRKLVRDAAPDGEERPHKGWGNIGYYSNGQFCYIMPQRNWVNLGFYKGTDLPDPHGLLEGTGKRLRHVKVVPERNVPVEQLKGLVREAFQLNVG